MVCTRLGFHCRVNGTSWRGVTGRMIVWVWAAARRIRETGRNGMQAALAHWSPQDSLPGPDQALPEPPADEGLVRAGLLEREGGRLLFGPRGVLGDELIRGHGRRGVCGSGRQWEAMFGPSLAMT